MTQTATKTVQIIARIAYKNNSKAVVYIVRSSNGNDQYRTTIYNGKATGCTCPSTSPRGCYHMTQLQEREAMRTPAAPVAPQEASVIAEAVEVVKVADEKRAVRDPLGRMTIAEEQESMRRGYDTRVVGVKRDAVRGIILR